MFNMELFIMLNTNLGTYGHVKQCSKHGFSFSLVLDMVDMLMETTYTLDYVIYVSYFWVWSCYPYFFLLYSFNEKEANHWGGEGGIKAGNPLS